MRKPVALALLLLLLGALWIAAAATSGAPPPVNDAPLPSFEPSEKLPADGAVAFPVDI